MFLKLKTVFLLVFSLLMISCHSNKNSSQQENIDSREMDEHLIYANKQVVKEEAEQIERFIRRYHWKMKKTGSGLRYEIYSKGTGIKAEPGKLAVLKYNVRLISGTEIYSSDKNGLKEFIIGHGGVESGLEEGILLLRAGDRAKFIIPSHLGFGLLGDQDKVPPKSTLIYDLELIAIK
jgi:FKBP-type peptidyl-prolyl cis-trans isomerase FkpA